MIKFATMESAEFCGKSIRVCSSSTILAKVELSS
jgi:hypothetical protein